MSMNAQTFGISGQEAGPQAPLGLCAGGCTFASIGTFEDESGKVGALEVARCTKCGHGVTLPPLPEVAFLYDKRESQDFQQGENPIAQWIKRIAFKRQAHRLMKDVAVEVRTVLDFGCGSGLFTRRLADMLPQAEVTGSDFHITPPPMLAGRGYFPMSQLDAYAGDFDLVLAMHVLEHDDDAAGLLDRIAGMARPGGTVVIEVPNVDCFWTPIFGRNWDAWYVPFHRSHFSKRSFRALLEHGELDVVAVVPACVPTMGRSLANLFNARKGFVFLLLGAALHPLQMIGEWLSGRPSAWRIIARKR
jgi:SAM-dependent methyltransferase